MVIALCRRRHLNRGVLLTELLVAIMLLAAVLLPVAYSIASEQRLARACYGRAVAMEIVDGEMEALLAGDWRSWPAGTHEYPVHAAALTNLPPGRFLLSIDSNHVRLEWRPSAKHHGGVVVRDAIAR